MGNSQIQLSNFLIVEDEFLIAETIAEILKKAGCQAIRLVATMEEALHEIEIERPSMVLTDINLGQHKTGIDLGLALYNTYHIPFIYITSHASSDIIEKAKYSHPNAYIIKPFKNEDLLIAIELALFNSTVFDPINNVKSEIAIKEGRALIFIETDKIIWLETDKNYTTLNIENGKRRVVRTPLSSIQLDLPQENFIRIHKSYIINTKYVSEILPNSLIIQGVELKIGRTYQDEIAAKFKNAF
jgi:two-component system response regulator LytT